jgi:hypothetical protein
MHLINLREVECWELSTFIFSSSFFAHLSLLFFLTAVFLYQNLSTLLVECWKVVNFHIFFLLLCSSLYFSFILQFFFTKTSQLYLLNAGKSSTFTFSSSFFAHLSIFLSYYSKLCQNLSTLLVECWKVVNFHIFFLLLCSSFSTFLSCYSFSLPNLSTLLVECWKVVNFHILFLFLCSSFSTFLSYYSFSLPKPLNFTC